MNKGIGIAGIFIVMLLFTVSAAIILGTIFSGETGNVALIPIEGTIGGGFSAFSSSASSINVVSDIEDASLNPDIQAVVFRIDSPGGTIVSTKEISTAIKEMNKPSICWLRETAASGAYWIASNCDVIVADEYTITGSIGVIGSYLEFSGLMEDYNVSYVRLVSGSQKDMGTPFREPTKEETEYLQGLIDDINQAFLKEITDNRNLSAENVEKIETSRIILGNEAFELGLVDVLGSKNEVAELILNMTDIENIQFVSYAPELGLSELMAGFFGKSMADRVAENEFKISAR